MVNKIRSQWRQEGTVATLHAAVETLLHPFVRHHQRLIWEVRLTNDRPPSEWGMNERLLIVGPENLQTEMTPSLEAFLGGSHAAAEADGIQGGDRLFVVVEEMSYLAYSYIFFDTTRETRRQARILGETRGTPIIGLSYTAPAARGRGLYRQILNEMFRFLARRGYTRAVCEVDPRNTPSNKASAAAGMQVCRELSDWVVLRRVMIQNVRESGRNGWRLVWV
jgi:GNAT superfamily N-acetyltransferase